MLVTIDVLQLGLGPDLLDEGIGQAEGDGHLGARVVELVLDLAGHVLGIAGHHDAADHERGIVGDDELGAVGQVDGHPVALLDAQRLQGSGKPLGQLQELAVGHGGVHERVAQRFHDVAKDQCRLVRVLGSRIQQELLQGHLGVIDRGRHAGIVLVEPGLFHRSPPPVNTWFARNVADARAARLPTHQYTGVFSFCQVSLGNASRGDVTPRKYLSTHRCLVQPVARVSPLSARLTL